MSTQQHIPKHKIFIIIALFFLALSIFRIGWIFYYKTPDHPQAENGVIDLSEWEFDEQDTITLDGEWTFYPQQFLNPTLDKTMQGQLISVPNDWQDEFSDTGDIPAYGFGTYRLKVILPDEAPQQLYGILPKGITSAAKVYIEGRQVATSGQPSEDGSGADGMRSPFSGLFQPDDQEIDVMVHVSNYDMPLWGGINKSIKIGTDQAISKEANGSSYMQILVSVIFLLHALYAFFIYFMGRGKYQKEILYFGMMLAIHAFSILIDDDMPLHLPIDLIWYYKLLLFLFLSTLFSLLVFIKHLFQVDTRFFKMLTISYILLAFGGFVISIQYLGYMAVAIVIFYIAALSFLFTQTIKTIRKGHPDGLFILLFITSYTSNMIWGALINFRFVEIPYYPFDFIISIIIMALLLFKRYMRLAKMNDEQRKALQAADQMKDEFLANTSHEVRNPLHGMINIAQSILKDTSSPLSNRQRENLTLLTNIGNRMSFTLNDLSTVTQLKEKEIQLHQSNVSLHSVTAFVIDMLEFMKEGKNISLHTRISPDFPDILADENRLVQILFNLVHNAIKYTNEGSVTVEANYSDDMARIYVKDTGIGIPSQQNMESIFKAYEQLDHRQNTAVSGIGIGLSVSKQLVELHGGALTYQSSSKGTTFMFTMPLMNETTTSKKQIKQPIGRAEIAAAAMYTQHETSSSLNKQLADRESQILIVDDDPVNIKVLSQLLADDYVISTSLSGEEALRKLDRQQFELVISDVMMPGMSGYELTETIRKQYTMSELPILLITARDLPEDIYVAFESGANDYLIKPVNSFEIKTRVKALTDLKHSIKELLRLEAAWLQAQIHPHFLLNTLNSIAALAEIDKERMVELLESFGDYLRRSFSTSNVDSHIPLTDEIELVQSYLNIERVRFGDRLHVELDIDDVWEYSIPPISIQPLVENAVIHGVLKKAKGGTVHIQVKDQIDEITINIADDGVGIGQDKIDELLDYHYVIGDGVGVKNTHRRLTKLYGQGLDIQSEVGEGTVIQFNVPKKE